MSAAREAVAAATTVNGINVTALVDTIAAISANPELARFNFRAANHWLGAEKTRTTIRDFTGALQEHRIDSKGFTVDTGEPPVLLGIDHAPNAGEWMLHALIGCVTGTIVYHAAARNIVVDAIESRIDGDVDLRGFLGLSDQVRKGFIAIHVRMRVKTKATAAVIKELATFSPMLDVVSRSVPVSLDIETC